MPTPRTPEQVLTEIVKIYEIVKNKEASPHGGYWNQAKPPDLVAVIINAEILEEAQRSLEHYIFK